MIIFVAIYGLIFFLAIELLVFLPLYIMGIPVSWFASRWAKQKTVPSRLYPDRSIVAYENGLLDWWVGNYEDGAKPVFDWWPAEKSTLAWFLRNPVTNLRFTPIISTKPDPFKLRYVGSDSVPPKGVPGRFLAWQGPYVGFLYQNTSWGVWVGWKLNTRDRRYLAPDDYRIYGIGTACQFHRF